MNGEDNKDPRRWSHLKIAYISTCGRIEGEWQWKRSKRKEKDMFLITWNRPAALQSKKKCKFLFKDDNLCTGLLGMVSPHIHTPCNKRSKLWNSSCFVRTNKLHWILWLQTFTSHSTMLAASQASEGNKKYGLLHKANPPSVEAPAPNMWSSAKPVASPKMQRSMPRLCRLFDLLQTAFSKP